MADKWYAWSPIRYGVERDTTDPTVIKSFKQIGLGEVVTAKKMNLSADEFDVMLRELVESGAVRSMEYPDVPDTWSGSPVEWLREKARRAASGVYDDAAVSDAATLEANMSGDGTHLLPEDEVDETPPDEK